MGVSKMKQAEYKVPGGKLLAVEVDERDGELLQVKISGDFFMHPEDAIIDLEKTLCNSPLSELEERVKRFFYINKVTLFGVEPTDFIKVIKKAISS
jgi:lipoate-protein ligase A